VRYGTHIYAARAIDTIEGITIMELLKKGYNWLHHNPLYVTFDAICMPAMIIMLCMDPSGFVGHIVSSYTGLFNAVTGTAATTTAAMHAGHTAATAAAATTAHAGAHAAATIAATPGLTDAFMAALDPGIQAQFSALPSDVMSQFNGLSAGMKETLIEQLPSFTENGLGLSDAIKSFCFNK
jgi:hypothetical protein